ncbi:hypothetical protein [Sporosarcina sp. FSL W7-1283]|uniref:hypothetical protein n=1 Tax=Sporosarcina sp. FSL W7-1283 TaxID=2921560 RepID=UPI0030FC0816
MVENKQANLFDELLYLIHGNSIPENIEKKVCDDGSVLYKVGQPNLKRLAKIALAQMS